MRSVAVVSPAEITRSERRNLVRRRILLTVISAFLLGFHLGEWTATVL
jgi:hypothetical protein